MNNPLPAAHAACDVDPHDHGGNPMLVLTRRVNETIEINVPGCDPITVMVTQVRGGQIGIGIDAPAEVQIARGELLEGEASDES